MKTPLKNLLFKQPPAPPSLPPAQPVPAFSPEWLTFLAPGYRHEFPRRDLFAARFGAGRLELFLQTGQVLSLGTSDPFRRLSEVLDEGALIQLASARNLALFTPGSLAKYFMERFSGTPAAPASWSLRAPWAMLEEFVVNLEAVDEMCWRSSERPGYAPTLILRTSPGPAFELRVSEGVAATITHAVREKATFTHPEVETFIFAPLAAPAQPAALRPDPHPFSTGQKRLGR